MAFLKLTSGNPNLSWVLEKNPKTGIVIRSNRQGYLFGFFPMKEEKIIENEYCIYFKDASDEVSYKEHPDQSFEYLSSSKYINARFINDAIQELMASARDDKHTYKERGEDHDIPARQSIVINMVGTQYKTMDIFQRYFPEMKIQSEEIVKNNFRLTFESLTDITLGYFLNLVNLFGIFAVLNSEDFVYIHEGAIEKYLRILNKIDVPYFIRYLFKIRLLRSPTKYKTLVEELRKTEHYDSIEFTYGDTHDARIAWIKEHVGRDQSIVDIGAGIDFRYLKIFAPALNEKNIKYYAIEKDFDAQERIKAGIKNRQLDNVVLYESLNEFLLIEADILKKENFTIICTEVLEHNEISEVKEILGKMLNCTSFHQIIITVPNASFNKYYGITSRHADHKWEYTKEEFHKMITNYLLENNHHVFCEYFDIGDKVNGESVSTGLIIKQGLLKVV